MAESEYLETARLLPSLPTQQTVRPLSILDAQCGRFSPTGAIWVFDAPNDETVHQDQLVSSLRSSFITTLNSFPHWTGALQWAPYRPDGKHTERHGRGIISYGSSSDPGAEWRVVRHPFPVDQLVPQASDRISDDGMWIGSSFPQKLLVSSTPLALYNLQDYEGFPAMSVQISLFSCGGYTVSVKLAHLLADAQSLMVFMHQWATNCRGELQTLEDFTGKPVFDPEKLDACAAGDIDALNIDPELSAIARALPLHRFDWWNTSAAGYPPFLRTSTEASKPPPEEMTTVTLSPGNPGPWLTWDLLRPVSQLQIRFTVVELAHLQRAARLSASAHPSISKLDALLAYLWGLINISRGFDSNSLPEEKVYLNVTLGARTRTSPPLPASFIGSPIFLPHVCLPASATFPDKVAQSEPCSSNSSTISSLPPSSLGRTATAIRNTLSLFTTSAVSAMLHDAAHEAVPQRLWQAFLGRNHVIATSWLRLKVYDVAFIRGRTDGGGNEVGVTKGKLHTPRYVHAIMPLMDGCLQVMDAEAEAVSEVDGSVAKEVGARGGSVDISLYLESNAMERFMELRRADVRQWEEGH